MLTAVAVAVVTQFGTAAESTTSTLRKTFADDFLIGLAMNTSMVDDVEMLLTALSIRPKLLRVTGGGNATSHATRLSEISSCRRVTTCIQFVVGHFASERCIPLCESSTARER